jgi:hypothetical protein
MQQHKNGVLYVAPTVTITMQQSGKNTSTTIDGLCFLHGPCQGVVLKKTGLVQSVQWSSVLEAVKKRVESQPMKRRLGGWYEMAASLGVVS